VNGAERAVLYKQAMARAADGRVGKAFGIMV
jgi:hypothetical protein